MTLQLYICVYTPKKLQNINTKRYLHLNVHSSIIYICSNMDGLGQHYTKWNKSEREGLILYGINYMQSLTNATN